MLFCPGTTTTGKTISDRRLAGMEFERAINSAVVSNSPFVRPPPAFNMEIIFPISSPWTGGSRTTTWPRAVLRINTKGAASANAIRRIGADRQKDIHTLPLSLRFIRRVQNLFNDVRASVNLIAGDSHQWAYNLTSRSCSGNAREPLAERAPLRDAPQLMAVSR